MKKIKPRLVISIALIIAAAVIVYIYREKLFGIGKESQNTDGTPTGGGTTTVGTLDRNKMVKRGSDNNEVLEVQILTNEEMRNFRVPTFKQLLVEDGKYGEKTEKRVLFLTTKNSTSINQLITDMPKTRIVV